MKDAEERELVRLCTRHDRLAWDKFVTRYGGYINSVILYGLRAGRFPHSSEDAEDIFAEVFLSLVEKDFHLLKSFQWRCSLKTWLWVITRKKVIRHFRKKGVRTVSLIDGLGLGVGEGGSPGKNQGEKNPLDAAQMEERRVILEQLLDELSDRDRLCLVLFFYDGLSYKEIAKVLGIPASHVGILIFRAKKRLEKKLEIKGIREDLVS